MDGEKTGGAVRPVSPELLYRRADLSHLGFTTTDELEPLEGFVGQERALDAARMSAGIDRPGFHLFAVGRFEVRMREAVKAVLDKAPRSGRPPNDWIYVDNFKDPRRPVAISMPAGQAPVFAAKMDRLVEDLKAQVATTFSGEEYQSARMAIDERFQKEHLEALEEVGTRAAEQGVALLRTPTGFTLMPAREGKVVPPEDFNTWPEEQRKSLQKIIIGLEDEVEHIVHQVPRREKQRREALRDLNRSTAERALGGLLDEIAEAYADQPAVCEHLQRVRTDLVDNVAGFISTGEGDGAVSEQAFTRPFERYGVNVMVSNADDRRAPVVEELNPSLTRLMGTVEHIAHQGALLTNFRLIRAGAVHRANGGFLLLDARHLLTEPFSWMALKRALRSGCVTVEDISRLTGLSSTVSLEPDPIPLDVKVVIFADRALYSLLSALDPEIAEHFKVLAEFEDDIDRSAESEGLLARLVASLVRAAALLPVERAGIERVLEHSSRLADDAGRLSVLVDQVRDILQEADFWARETGVLAIRRSDVDRAIQARRRRASRVQEIMHRMILDEVSHIATSGARVGEINGLSVFEVAGAGFGKPTRISARVRPGSGQVIDIEREVELGGPLHSKGMLILTGYLSGAYALDVPGSLHASLVFEQSYGGVEGDSASLGELCALLSAISQLPARQELAVTGSVSQHGQVQAIGGVNEKIEGFFDICEARGLTGAQGVIIPRSNLKHLMLRRDVVEACAENRFAIYAVETVDQAMELFTGRPAGGRGSDGRFPDGSINRKVEDRLRAFADVRKTLEGERRRHRPLRSV